MLSILCEILTGPLGTVKYKIALLLEVFFVEQIAQIFDLTHTRKFPEISARSQIWCNKNGF